MTQLPAAQSLAPALRKALDWAENLGRAADCELIIDSGTLLGLIRDGAPIAGDLDLDLSSVDEGAFERLAEALRGRGAKIWTYAGRPYRAEIAPEATGLPLAAEVKFFRRAGAFHDCPAIGFATPGKKKQGFSVRSLLRPLWRKVLADSDAGRFPMKHFTRVDAWRVPAAFFDDRVALEAWPHCFTPREVEDYLSFRYGDWRTPVSDWVSWRDDGAYQPSSAQMQAARSVSPHRKS